MIIISGLHCLRVNLKQKCPVKMTNFGVKISSLIYFPSPLFIVTSALPLQILKLKLELAS